MFKKKIKKVNKFVFDFLPSKKIQMLIEES